MFLTCFYSFLLCVLIVILLNLFTFIRVEHSNYFGVASAQNPGNIVDIYFYCFNKEK